MRVSTDIRPLEGVDLMRCFVEGGLNGRNPDAACAVFSPRFIDHSPYVPPHGSPVPNHQSLTNIIQLVKYLTQPDVDMQFSLEDIFSDGKRVGYRLFGEGTVKVPGIGSRAKLADSSQASVREIHRLAPHTFVHLSRDAYFRDSVHMEYTGIGILKIDHGRFSEHWGSHNFQ